MRKTVLFVLAAALTFAPAAAAFFGTTEWVSVSKSYGSLEASVTPDGRYVVFSSAASDLVKGDRNGFIDVYLKDRWQGTYALVSTGDNGHLANNESRNPSLSADGRYIVFESRAGNLVPNDTNLVPDIFVKDMASGITKRISVSSAGVQGNAESYNPVISADGRFVTYHSYADNLVPGDTNYCGDIFVYEMATGITARVSVTSDGTQSNGHSYDPAISADGRFVAFHSESYNLVPGDTNLCDDVFVHDRASGQTVRVSISSDGVQGKGASRYPAISADGRFISFESYSDNLVPGDVPHYLMDVYVHDRDADGDGILDEPGAVSTVEVSVTAGGIHGNESSISSSISGDGRYVAFESAASNLVPDDTNNYRDVFVKDLVSGQITRVSLSSTGGEGDNCSYSPAITPDGAFVVFNSLAGNLVLGDVNTFSDVFIHY